MTLKNLIALGLFTAVLTSAGCGSKTDASKAVVKAYVSPFLFNIDPLRIVGPLSQFQATINDPDDILRLLSSINNRLPEDQRLSFDVLNREFELLWPDLKKRLDKAAETQDLETHTGFPWLYNADDVARRQELR